MMKLGVVAITERDELCEALAQSGRVEIKARLHHYSGLEEVLAEHRPAVLFADLEPQPEAALGALERIPAPRPAFLVYGPDQSHVILRVMRLGAREYVSESIDEKDQLLDAIERLLRDHESQERGEQRIGSVAAVMGAKGGVGATFVASQLAAALATNGARVAIVDLNLRIGDVALYFDLQPRYTIANVAHASELDTAYLETILASHASGVQVLAAPKAPEEADVVAPSHIDRTLAILQDQYDWIVIDTPSGFDERTVNALDRANQILIVTNSDVPALNHARLQIDLLGRLGHTSREVHLILNRADKRSPVPEKELVRFLGRPSDVAIPNDYENASTCVNEGRSIQEVAPRSGLRTAINELSNAVHAWCGRSAPQSEKQTISGLRGLIRRRLHGTS